MVAYILSRSAFSRSAVLTSGVCPTGVRCVSAFAAMGAATQATTSAARAENQCHVPVIIPSAVMKATPNDSEPEQQPVERDRARAEKQQGEPGGRGRRPERLHDREQPQRRQQTRRHLW